MKKQKIGKQKTIVKVILMNLILVIVIYIICCFTSNNLKDTVKTKIAGKEINNALLEFEEEKNIENNEIKKALQEISYAYYKKGAYI